MTRFALVAALLLGGCWRIPPGMNWQGSPPQGTRPPTEMERAAMDLAWETWEAREDLPSLPRRCETLWPLWIYPAPDVATAVEACGARGTYRQYSCARQSQRSTTWIVTHVGRSAPTSTVIHETLHKLSDCAGLPSRAGEDFWACRQQYPEILCTHVDSRVWGCSSAGDAASAGCSRSVETETRNLAYDRGIVVDDWR